MGCVSGALEHNQPTARVLGERDPAGYVGLPVTVAVYYKDRSGQTSPPRTATLFGTALSMEVASCSSTVSTTSTLTFAVDTLCVHGDTPGAAELTRVLREGLEQRGVAVRALMPAAVAEHRPPAGPPPGRA